MGGTTTIGVGVGAAGALAPQASVTPRTTAHAAGPNLERTNRFRGWRDMGNSSEDGDHRASRHIRPAVVDQIAELVLARLTGRSEGEGAGGLSLCECRPTMEEIRIGRLGELDPVVA